MRDILHRLTSENESRLRYADRHGATIGILLLSGECLEARIRDVDWTHHRALTYFDLDAPCAARVLNLDEIADLLRLSVARVG